MGFNIKKSSGQLESFDKNKLRRSLTRPGASTATVDAIINYIEKHLDKFPNTSIIYNYALAQLEEKEPHIATRYSLKKALLEFGPTGFPFERYVAELFNHLGYKTVIDQIIGGWCVDHEVDVILKKNNESSFVECKFHNVAYYTTDVQVALYIDARFYDIKKAWHSDGNEKLGMPWIVTNTNFTFEAIKYSNCKHIKLLGWNYPKHESLADIIDKERLYPITAMVFLNEQQKKLLLDNNIILCRDIEKHISVLKKIGFSQEIIDKMISCCHNTCQINS